MQIKTQWVSEFKTSLLYVVSSWQTEARDIIQHFTACRVAPCNSEFLIWNECPECWDWRLLMTSGYALSHPILCAGSSWLTAQGWHCRFSSAERNCAGQFLGNMLVIGTQKSQSSILSTGIWTRSKAAATDEWCRIDHCAKRLCWARGMVRC